MRFSYIVRRGDDLIATGWTRHAVIGPNGRPRALPAELCTWLAVKPLPDPV